MKKIFYKTALMTVMMLVVFASACYAFGEEYSVRVRIRSPRLYNQQAGISGYDDIAVSQDGDELLVLGESLSALIDSYYDGNYNFLTDSEKDSAKYGPFHISLSKSYSSFDEAEEAAENYEDSFTTDFYPFYDGEEFVVYAGKFKDKGSAVTFMGELNKAGINSDVVFSNLANIAVYDNFNNIVFMYENGLDMRFTSVNSKEDCSMIKIDGRPYRGSMGFKIIDGSKLLTINYVDLESYLYGVVPNEIAASWGIEALKAQAVAARTYAVYNINPKSAYGYDLEDNQNSQVYWGYAYEKSSTNQAVDETKGQMIYYEGKLIQAFYHSTSGGKTEDSENVWTTSLPYARGVDDEYTDNSGSPYNQWQKNYAKDEIIKKLNDDGNSVSELYGIEIRQVSENNRVMECIFLTDNGEISYKKENARLLLGLMSSWFTVGNGSVFYFADDSAVSSQNSSTVPSRGILDSITGNETAASSSLISGGVIGKYAVSSSGNKKINQEKLAFISSDGVKIVDTNSAQYSFDGRGWGHGIGMSQYGAKEMASEGFTYDEILKHYYTGVTIK
ncbi:MAG: SpoIID/LytB domain-containing protein [Sedimentibacter sp.]|uniref:SpoIID/LytB domain-containing protein n=1 Tax=Sedimentibacter sp. TaxID=1960295 RepID=UPI003158FDE5